MHGGHARTVGSARDGAFEQGEFCLIAAGHQFDISRRRVLHPTGDAEFRRVLMDEPPESNTLHPPYDPQVDDRHVRMG